MSVAFKKLRPLLNRIIVQKPEATKVSKGGIILKSQESVSWGTVIAVGPGRMMENGNLRECSVQVGDNVLLPEYGGSTVKLANEEYHIYRDDDIIGFLMEKVEEWLGIENI